MVDAGADVKGTLRALKKHGYIPEGMWKQAEKSATPWTLTPRAKIRNYAKKRSNRNFIVHEIPERSFYNVLLSGHAILVDINIGSEGLRRKRTSIGPYGVDMVDPFTGSIRGGHAMLIVGAIVDPGGKIYYLLQNSWGEDWVFGYMSREDYLVRTKRPFGIGYTLTFKFPKNQQVA
jgi:hypothetical protein